jgi:SET domain-containing protein
MQQDVDFIIKKTKTGLGLIAIKPILKGKRIIEYVGPLVSNEIVERSNGKYFFEVNTKWSIDGSQRGNIARYINHSCQPNAEAFVSQNRRVWIWSRKKIKPGEEITYDYGEEYFEGIIEPMGCRCKKCSSKTRRSRARKSRSH